MDNFAIIKNFMINHKVNYLLVNSTNEFLVEYNTLEENSRYKLTNFSGSTGEALVSPETIYLFVDGRYHIQADQEVDHNKITVVKLQTGQKFIDELLKRIPEQETLGVFSKKISLKKAEEILSKRQVKFLDEDPLDNNKKISTPNNILIDKKYSGFTANEKISKISQNLTDDEAIYITDLDEVSYIFNMRNYSQKYSAKINAKAIILKDNSILFTPNKMHSLEEFLKSTQKTILIDKSSINVFDYNLLSGKAEELIENPIKLMKARKNNTELEHLKEAFNKTDIAVSAIRNFIYNNENISEYDIATRLEEEFKKQGAVGLSFKSIVAKDKNSALAHYSKSSKEEIITDGSLILIDCGAYFEGGLATDITRVFVKGDPTKLQKKIYTLVLKAFLNAFNFAKVNSERPIIGYDIDKSIRDFFDTTDTEGFIFNHGLGHGIGINVHEYPPNLSSGEIAQTPILDGMCFSIEPGLYKEGAFGVRLENSCYFKDNDIHSFVNMNYEKKLIDFDMLTEQEKQWLQEFEVK